LRISRIQIDNFRNFHHLDVALAGNAVIVGENKIGKSNLLHALRLILDPSLPDTARQLKDEDFWDGIERPLNRESRIRISIDLASFEGDENQVALLAEHLVEPDPMVARITFLFQVREDVEGNPAKDADYEFFIYGADRPENHVGYDVRRGLPLDLLPALRDAEGDLANWRRSPLRPLLDSVGEQIDRAALNGLAHRVDVATEAIAAEQHLRDLVGSINSRIRDMVGTNYAIETELGFAPSDPARLLRALRLLIDAGRRDIAAASLGSANVLYLGLKSLQLDEAVRNGDRHHTFLAIEEPEAHLHPHLQRLVYREFLREQAAEHPGRPVSILLTTHSPHIASVAPLDSIIVLRRAEDEDGTVAVSASGLGLAPEVVADLERYLDVTRAEMLFAKGIILVEGDAERFLVPALAAAEDIDLDELGISVCAIGGTNFDPYVTLIGSRGLNIPFAVITDGDLNAAGVRTGHARVRNLLRLCVPPGLLADRTDVQKLEMARKYGLYAGDHTLEVDLFHAGAEGPLTETLNELAPGPLARTRAAEWGGSPATLNAVQFLKDIDAIGKGRFSQRLSAKIIPGVCPQYIADAIAHVQARCG